MKKKPVNIIIKGVSISNLTTFRWGQQLHEQQFFELRFNQSLLGVPFNSGFDETEKNQNQPIFLNFDDDVKKPQLTSATITRLEYLHLPGRQPEVVVTGTMYRKPNNVRSFTLWVMGLVLLPILYIGGLCLYAYNLSHNIVKIQGKTTNFTEYSYKSIKRYTFQSVPYSAKFSREYNALSLHFGLASTLFLCQVITESQHINNKGVPATFYIRKANYNYLHTANKKIDFIYLQPHTHKFATANFYYDLLLYAGYQLIPHIIWLCIFILNTICFIKAYIYYQMHNMRSTLQTRIIWWTSMTLTIIFNLAILVII